jgi:hypothetical protein
MNKPRFLLTWLTEDESDEEWLPGEQHQHQYFANNKTEIKRRYLQAKTEQGYDFELYVWNWNQYALTNTNVERMK